MKDKKVKKTISFLALLVLSILIVISVAYFMRKVIDEPYQQRQLIGGQTDEHGCLGSAGYTWCDPKQACVRTWEDGCDTLSADQKLQVENYLNNNISTLSPQAEVLGGKYYITKFVFNDNDKVSIEYEDGHVLHKANLEFNITDSVKITNFNLIQ